MLRQIRVLTKAELCNLYGFNVLRHTKDRKTRRKSIAMGVLMVLLCAMFAVYAAGFSYSLVMMGAAELVLTTLILLDGVLIIVLGMPKTGGMLFRRNGYDMISALPLKDGAVVLSRFIRLYVEDLAMTLILMVPGLAVYAVYVRPGVHFYLLGILSVLVVPLIPVAVASVVGAAVTGIASRMKHKAIVEAGVTILFVLGITGLSTLLSGNEEEMTIQMMMSLVSLLEGMFGNIYPPAIWIGKAVVQGDILSFLLAAAVSALIFAAVVAVVTLKFHAICRGLYSTSARHDYRMQHLRTKSVRKTLVWREMKRYFSSGVYVTNTIMGPLMGTALCIGLLFFDLDSIPGILSVADKVKAAVPIAVAGVFSMLVPSSVSISMEGKEWWIIKSLPLTTRQILDGKLLFSLCLMAPFLAVSEIFMVIALRPNRMELVWMILIPMIILVFSAVWGITFNLFLPKLEWENEVTVVKQSASAMFGGMGGFLIVILCIAALILLPGRYLHVIRLVICVLLTVLTAVLYRRNNRVDLKML